MHSAKYLRPTSRIRLLLVGLGGNGSQMLVGLARTDQALKALGWAGLSLTAADPDLVSEASAARQHFYPADVGRNKAVALVNRVNLTYGLNWEAETSHYPLRRRSSPDLLITCVDNRQARLQAAAEVRKGSYWMDLGNDQFCGQVLLGNGEDLPWPHLIAPDLIDTELPEDSAPSCSALESLARQDLFVNQAVSTFALNLLWRLLRWGKLEYHGGYINLLTGQTRPLAVPPPQEPQTAV